VKVAVGCWVLKLLLFIIFSIFFPYYNFISTYILITITSGAFGVVHKGTWRGATVAVKKLLVVMDEALLQQEIRREATVIQYSF